MSLTRYLHDVHAYNYRMTNVQAAFLYDQLNDLDAILGRKRQVFDYYEKLFQGNKNVKLFEKEENTEKADWIFAIRIVGNPKSIEETTDFFRNHNVDIRPFFYPIHKHLHLSSIKNDDEVSVILNREIIMIPSSPTITNEEQQIVANVVYEFCATTNSFV
jgi:perosamine synthetase